MLKSIKWAKPYPLYQWENPRLKEVKQDNCNNMDLILGDLINESYKKMIEEKLYKLFDTVFVKKLLWRLNKSLLQKLSKSGEEYEKATHDKYLVLMNNCAFLLFKKITDLLVNLAKVATQNQTEES